jgi:hypothetical protein
MNNYFGDMHKNGRKFEKHEYKEMSLTACVCDIHYTFFLLFAKSYHLLRVETRMIW